MPYLKTEFPIVRNKINNTVIALRLTDGYINATAICEECDKNLDECIHLKVTSEFMKELSKEIGIPTSNLIQPFASNNSTINGIWVHPQVAINLAQWASPKFAVLVPQWVFLWLTEQAPDTHKTVVKEENTGSKFDNYDPEFAALINKALAYNPTKNKKKVPKK